MARFKRGETVEWNTSQGPTQGTVVGTVTHTRHVKGYTAEATPAHPEIEVRSTKSGKTAVHLATALRKAR